MGIHAIVHTQCVAWNKKLIRTVGFCPQGFILLSPRNLMPVFCCLSIFEKTLTNALRFLDFLPLILWELNPNQA